MKASVIKKKKNTNRILITALMLISIWVIIAFALDGYSAGSAPKAATSGSKSAAEKRAEANEYFEQDRSYKDQEIYTEAARSYEKAVKADPAYAEMGNFDLAEKELKILRNLGSDEADELAAFIDRKRTGN